MNTSKMLEGIISQLRNSYFLAIQVLWLAAIKTNVRTKYNTNSRINPQILLLPLSFCLNWSNWCKRKLFIWKKYLEMGDKVKKNWGGSFRYLLSTKGTFLLSNASRPPLLQLYVFYYWKCIFLTLVSYTIIDVKNRRYEG